MKTKTSKKDGKNSLVVETFFDNGYHYMGGQMFRWTLAIGDESYGLVVPAGISKGFSAVGIARCVEDMAKEIRRIVGEDENIERGWE